MNKKYYIIGYNYSYSAGLISIVFCNLSYIIYAINNGYIPVVDMKHFINPYIKDNKTFKDNTWEYYFEQPLGYKLDDIDDNSEVKISNPEFLRDCHFPKAEEFPVELTDYKLDEKLQKYKDYYNKYIKFNNETKQYIEEKYKTIIGDEKEVLGVFARGTDYTIRRSKDHCIQPTIEQLTDKVKIVLKQYPEIKKIYLATEDLDIYNSFKNEFKEMIIDNGQYRFSYQDKNNKYKFLNQIDIKRENHNYKLGLEYLTSLYILSKCKYFVGGRAGGSTAVYYMSNGFKYYYSFYLGIYGRGKERLFSVVTENSDKYTYKVYNIIGLKLKVRQDKNANLFNKI